MMYRVNNVSAGLDAPRARVAARALKIAEGEVLRVRVRKKSVDARDRGDVHFVYSLDVETRRRVPGAQCRRWGWGGGEHRLAAALSAARRSQTSCGR